jgi:hypothetical protein
METTEAPPAADKAREFRGSGANAATNGSGVRNAATVKTGKNDQTSFAPAGAKLCEAFLTC